MEKLVLCSSNQLDSFTAAATLGAYRSSALVSGALLGSATAMGYPYSLRYGLLPQSKEGVFRN